MEIENTNFVKVKVINVTYIFRKFEAYKVIGKKCVNIWKVLLGTAYLQ